MPIQVLLTSIATNIGLCVLKVVGGLVSGSAGLLADGFHSLTDVIAMSVNYVGVKISMRPAQGLEAYENYKKEILGTFVVSFFLFVIGLFILVRSYLRLTAGVIHSPGLGAALVILVAFAITYWLYLYSRKESKQSDSPGLEINTEQIRLNVLSTIAVLIGIVGSIFDMNYLDALAAIVVALIILYSSLDIILKFLKEMGGARLSAEQVKEITALAAKTSPTLRVVRLKTMIVRKKIWLLLETVEGADVPTEPGVMQRLKTDLLACLPYLDNVIAGPAPPTKTKALKVEVEDFGAELHEATRYLSFVFAVVLLLMASASAFGLNIGSREYHVLIPADRVDPGGPVSAALGRARYFYLYRIDRERGQFIQNGLAFVQGDIDRGVAKLLKNYCVEAVVARNVGPELFRDLSSAHITLYRAAHNVPIRQQIEALRRGELDELVRPNVGARFGLKNLRLLGPWQNWQSQ